MNQLVTYIQSVAPRLNPEALERIGLAFRPIHKEKGELLLAQGDVCKDLYFLVEGICRFYSLKDGTEVTNWFSFKNDFITSFSSFFTKSPSYESIEMLTDGSLYQISYQKLAELQESAIEIERLINYFSNLYTVQLENRILFLQTMTAAEKYQMILKEEPHLIQHIPNKHLASYLGITRETISRIRSSIN